MFAVRIGNPAYGVRFVGPFATAKDAHEWANSRIVRAETTVVRIEQPNDPTLHHLED